MKFFENRKGFLLTISKYIFSFILLCLAYTSNGGKRFLIVGLLELVSIAMMTNALLKVDKKWTNIAAYLFNIVLLFLYNAQNLVMFFGRSFTTLVMLTNLESLESLKGNALAIGVGVLALLVFTFLPVSRLEFKLVRTSWILSTVLLLELAMTALYGNSYSPIFAVYRLGLDARVYQQQMAAIADQPDQTKKFYKPEIKSSIEKPDSLPDQPNVVLIFAEGLSQNIIDDERNVMPHLKELQAKSLNFTNYYNHTFATYRGLIGQLYSGYQLNNYDSNSLISMQDILADQGYQTTFINTEPANTQFTTYLESLNFQELINDASKADGVNGSLTDKTAFDVLYKTISQKSKSEQPFFTAMYTYGTHMSFDTADKSFGDGSLDLLDRFYNFDYHFNNFLKKFDESGLSENTILVFTADHSTFQDKDFTQAYPDYPRVNSDVDRMPLFIYHKGVLDYDRDVEGRNSLSMAPTVLDYLDISAPNYFLGQSLFFYKENNNSFDTVFYDNAYLLSTDHAAISSLSETNEQTVRTLLDQYFAAKTQLPQKP